MTKLSFQSWFLARTLEQKFNIMRDALLSDNLGVFMQLVDVVIEAPISQGGVATDDLKKAFGSDLTNPNHFTHGERFSLPSTPDAVSTNTSSVAASTTDE